VVKTRDLKIVEVFPLAFVLLKEKYGNKDYTRESKKICHS